MNRKKITIYTLLSGVVAIAFISLHPPEKLFTAADKKEILNSESPLKSPQNKRSSPVPGPNSENEVVDDDMVELERISQELLAYKNRVGDDPTKMTDKEIEDQVTLLNAYNQQFKIVIEKYQKELL